MECIVPITILVSTTVTVCCSYFVCLNIYKNRRMRDANKFINSMGKVNREIELTSMSKIEI